MDSIEKIKKDFKELEERLNKLEKKDNKRWRAKFGELYYYINSKGIICDTSDERCNEDYYRYSFHNYFKTESEAQAYLDNINTYYDLMNLAEELNNGEEIDWENDSQIKYCIYYSFDFKEHRIDCNYTWKDLGQIYCLDIKFLEKAKERIGEDRLIKLFKGE